MGDTLASKEGVTLPLISRLPKILTHVWQADDAYARGSVSALHNSYQHLCDLGPHYGYIANAVNTCFVLKPPFQARASELFAGTEVNLSTSLSWCYHWFQGFHSNICWTKG